MGDCRDPASDLLVALAQEVAHEHEIETLRAQLKEAVRQALYAARALRVAESLIPEDALADYASGVAAIAKEPA